MHAVLRFPEFLSPFRTIISADRSFEKCPPTIHECPREGREKQPRWNQLCKVDETCIQKYNMRRKALAFPFFFFFFKKVTSRPFEGAVEEARGILAATKAPHSCSSPHCVTFAASN